MEGSREYRDYRIDFSCSLATAITEPYVRTVDPNTVIHICRYSIYKNNEPQFEFVCKGTLKWFRSLDDSEFNRFRNHGFDIARRLIDTEKYKEFKEGEVPEFYA